MDRMPLLSHVEELFVRFRRCFLWIVVGAGIGYYFADQIYDGLKIPIATYFNKENPLVFTHFFEKVGVLFRISVVAGLLVSSPFLGWEVLSFVKPGLKEKERAHLRTLITSFVVCFIAGCVVGYMYILPFIIRAVMSFGHSNLVPMLTVSSYVNAAIGIVLMSALFFEIPALMLNLSLWGWVKSATWSKARRHSVVVNAMVSAFLSPPDPWSMLLMMLPLQILFECGILLAKMGEKISNRGQQA